jgi:hypothetical protein
MRVTITAAIACLASAVAAQTYTTTLLVVGFYDVPEIVGSVITSVCPQFCDTRASQTPPDL